MTEQEKREKAIEEIIGVIKEVRPSYGIILLRVCANVIYDTGYRKEEEVQKETAKEILQTLFNNLKYPQYFQVYIETLAKKYGVEVEE